MQRFTFVVAIGLIGTAPALPAKADYTMLTDGQNMTSSYMRVYGVSLPPIGYVRFCERNPSDCRSGNAIRSRIKLTSERWQELVSVNKTVNQEVKPVTDQELYGQVEYWTYPERLGDCEDYVLQKRRLLMEKGWPSGTLLITVVVDENGEGHAILTARTTKGDFLLDNKRQEILAWNRLPYRYIKRQSFRNPQLWMSLIPSEDKVPVAAIDAIAKNQERLKSKLN